jgi:hypothetical protein
MRRFSRSLLRRLQRCVVTRRIAIAAVVEAFATCFWAFDDRRVGFRSLNCGSRLLSRFRAKIALNRSRPHARAGSVSGIGACRIIARADGRRRVLRLCGGSAIVTRTIGTVAARPASRSRTRNRMSRSDWRQLVAMHNRMRGVDPFRGYFRRLWFRRQFVPINHRFASASASIPNAPRASWTFA